MNKQWMFFTVLILLGLNNALHHYFRDYVHGTITILSYSIGLAILYYSLLSQSKKCGVKEDEN